MFKLDVFWNTLTPMVTTRVLRDCLSVQRIAKVSRADYVVACDADIHPALAAMGIPVTTDFTNPTMVRAYTVGDNLLDEMEDRLPDCEDTEVITLTLAPEVDNGNYGIDTDPYAGVKLFKDWKTIPPTLPLDKAPPKGPAEPMWSPFL